MAILGINSVSRGSQPAKQRGLSDFEKVVAGLNAARDAFGIYADYRGLEQTEAQTGLIEAQTEKLRAPIDPLDRDAKLADIDETRANIALKGAQTGDFLAKDRRLTSQQKREDVLRKEDRQIKETDAVGKAISAFREKPLYRENLKAILTAKVIDRALRNATGPADFIAIVGTIRAIAGDVGPLKESEIDFIKGRLGLKERFLGSFDKWVNNEFLTPDERSQLAQAVQDVAEERRDILDTLEKSGARDIASRFEGQTIDSVFPKIDSSDIFTVYQSELAKMRKKLGDSGSPGQRREQGASGSPGQGREPIDSDKAANLRLQRFRQNNRRLRDVKKTPLQRAQDLNLNSL